MTKTSPPQRLPMAAVTVCVLGHASTTQPKELCCQPSMSSSDKMQSPIRGGRSAIAVNGEGSSRPSTKFHPDPTFTLFSSHSLRASGWMNVPASTLNHVAHSLQRPRL